MSSAWGSSWAAAWGGSWGSISTGKSRNYWRNKKQEYVSIDWSRDLNDYVEDAKESKEEIKKEVKQLQKEIKGKPKSIILDLLKQIHANEQKIKQLDEIILELTRVIDSVEYKVTPYVRKPKEVEVEEAPTLKTMTLIVGDAEIEIEYYDLNRLRRLLPALYKIAKGDL